MSKKTNWKTLNIEGMSCTSCQASVESAVKSVDGIDKVRASYSKGAVEYTESNKKVDKKLIENAIKAEGYFVVEENNKAYEKNFTSIQFVGIAIIIIAIYGIVKNTVGFNFIPSVTASMGYFTLFVVGLVTSLHCVAMCGGINLSQCIKSTTNSSAKSYLKPSFLYNSGRVVSYTIIGGIVGGLGAAMSFTGATKGLVVIISGLFMIIMGLNLFGTFPWISKFVPKLPPFLTSKKEVASSGKGPFVVGLLNGLMPCGPLQAMQLYALGTGSFIAGASSMLVFSLGTVPLMLGLGLFSSMMSARFNKRMMQVGAVLVVFLGVAMLSRGFALSGLNFPGSIQPSQNATVVNESVNVATIENGVQIIDSEITSNTYPIITVQSGVPVKWNLRATEASLNGCNSSIIIPEFNIKKDLVPGDNIVEFTPTKSGTIPYSCWMGMIKSKIIVE
jgi:sulfite exporter TauE/SafE/copper chaperone CopZ